MTIVLKKETINRVFLEFEHSLLNPNYLFQFKSEGTNISTLFNSTEILGNCRGNLFEIIETGSTFTDLSNGIINMKLGTYIYNIYESTGSTLSISGTTGQILKTGQVVVIGSENYTPSTIDQFYL